MPWNDPQQGNPGHAPPPGPAGQQAGWGTPGWGQPGPYPGGPPQPPSRPPRRGLIIGLIAGAVVLALLGVGGFFALRQVADVPTPSDQAPAVAWSVGSCIRMISGPTDAQVSKVKSPNARRELESLRRYEPVTCGDAQALAKITKLGARSGPLGRVTDTGCPADADFAVVRTGILAGDSQVRCARNLKPPHPGDPGNGGGGILIGDCAVVSSGDGVRVTNDRIEETPCDPKGYFAKILAVKTSKAGCPAPTISRFRLPGRSRQILCLGQGERGLIAKPGECVDLPSNSYYSPTKISCSKTNLPYRLVAIVDREAQCAAGTHGRPYSGYDRILCIRNPDGS